MGGNATKIGLLLIILTIGTFFRLWQITDIPPGLYPDEAMNGNNALEALRTGDFKVFYPENNGREGLFINIQALSIALFGNKAWALRIVSAFFGILTILFTYLFTKELFRNQELGIRNYEKEPPNHNSKFLIHDSKTQLWNIPQNELIALFAAFFIAISFWHINFSRIGFRAIMAPFFLTSSMYFAWLLFKDSLSQTKKTLAAVVGGIMLGAGFYSYIAYRLMPLLLVFPLFAMVPKKNSGENSTCNLCAFALFIFFAFVTVMPLGIYYFGHPDDFLGRTSQVSVFSSERPLYTLVQNTARTVSMFWWEGDGNWRHNFAGSPQLWWPQGLLFGFGILWGIWRIFKKKGSFPFLFLFSWVALGLLPVLLSNEGIPHALRAILIIPPVMIIAAYAFAGIIIFIREWLIQKKTTSKQYTRQLNRIGKELIILLFIVFLGFTMHTFNQYMLRWAHHPEVYWAFNENYHEMGTWLHNQEAALKKYVIVNANGVPVTTPQSSDILPMPAQTILFLTDTWNAALQEQKNLHYVLPDQIKNISCDSQCIIIMLETDPRLRKELQNIIPDLKASIAPGFMILKK